MKIKGPRFATNPAMLGMRSVMVSDFPTENWRESLPELFGKVGPETLIILADQTRKLDDRPMFQFLKLGRLKGLRFGHIADLGFYPEWLQYLDQAIIEINAPKQYRFGEEYNEAVKELWFMKGHLSVVCRMFETRDLEMVELLYSYTPNDLDFWVDVSNLTGEDRSLLMPELLTRRFSTVRVI